MSTTSSSTPLPVLPLIVLSIAMLGEFLSANVSTPFLLFMVKGFGSLKDESEVAYWTGILVSVFFITQFITSLLWSTIADKYGRRLVLLVSLLGSAGACMLFGTSSSLAEAITIRLLQGVFAGAMGVARSTVTLITDRTNEGKAYAILGFCWGLGGVSGAIIGGSFESPAQKWPHIFPTTSVFGKLPYLLPCIIAGGITLIGAILSMFLSRNAGPRRSVVSLQISLEDEEGSSGHLQKCINSPALLARGITSYTLDLFRLQPQSSDLVEGQHAQATSDSLPLAIRLTGGSSYAFTQSKALRAAQHAQRGPYSRHTLSTASENDTLYHGEPNFTHRLFLANGRGTTTMADFWVDAAMTESAFQRELSSELNTAPDSNVSGMNLSNQHLSPSIFDHTGLRQQVRRRSVNSSHQAAGFHHISPGIAPETRSTWMQLPIAVILQYGFLALHSTIHDQIFLSYLVSSYDAGGLGLNASHFAQLIALMCLAQIAYQFYLYPNFGPPRGKFSHLTMFRLGAALFVPAYFIVIAFRGLASSPGEQPILMLALALSTAIRFCGSTFAYTSIAILLNYLSPAHVNSLANGAAQSIVSLARFVGPILGGYIWSMSIENGPAGYAWSFMIVTIVCCVALALSFTIR